MAGFHVTGVDHEPQKRYAGDEFVLDDALEFVAEHGAEFEVIAASPPCQRYSQATRITGNGESHPDLIPVVRELLEASGRPYVIENVPGAPLLNPVLVCGLSLGLGVKRHRLFESSVFLFGTTCPLGHHGDYISVFGNSVGEKIGGKGWVSVHGGGAPAVADRRRRADVNLARKAMGIDWMTRAELSQAIPPLYTFWVGKQIIRYLEESSCD